MFPQNSSLFFGKISRQNLKIHLFAFEDQTLDKFNKTRIFDYMSDIKECIDMLVRFRDERDWAQFHNGKDLALALSIEAAELNELFLWKQVDEADKNKLKEELADVFAYAFLLADCYQLDVKKIISDKMKLNEEKYPISKSKGSAKKYTDL